MKISLAKLYFMMENKIMKFVGMEPTEELKFEHKNKKYKVNKEGKVKCCEH